MVRFFTNLDDAQPWVHRMNRDGWKGAAPRIGESVRFILNRSRQTHFDLLVVNVTHAATGEHAEVELHMPRNFESIRAWMDYFKRHSEGA